MPKIFSKLPLCESDLAKLKASDLSDLTIRGARLRTENGALVFPYFELDGTLNCFARRRPHDGKPAKYVQPKDSPLRAYYAPATLAKLRDGKTRISITEGELKALAIAQTGEVVVGIGGVDCGLKDGELIPDLAAIAWASREAFIVFDYDEKPKTRQNVDRARRRLAGALRRAGARVHHVYLPGPEKGADDFIVARGADAFRELIERTKHRAAATRFSAAQLMAMDLPEPRCVVPGILTDGCNLLVSRPKLGKSWWALDLAIAIAVGGKFLGHDIDAGDVLYLALEDNARRLKARLGKLLGDSAPPERLTIAIDWPRADEGGIEEIQRWIDGADDPRLVVIDTVAKFKPRRSSKQGNAYADDYCDIGQLKAVADENEIALLAVHHDRKAQGTDILDDVSGTIGITGAADTILLLKRERGAHDACLHVTGRDVDEREIALAWDRDACRWSIMGNAESLRASLQRRTVLKALEDAGKPMTPTELTAALGWDKAKVNSVKQHLFQAAKQGQAKNQGGRYVVITDNSANPTNHTHSSDDNG